MQWSPAVQQQRLFVAQAVQVAESQWFAPGTDYGHPSDDGDIRPIRVERQHYVEVFLFPAEDEEDAYQKAMQWAANEADVNLDPPANRNVWYTLGLHELEEYRGSSNLSSPNNGAYEVIAAVSAADVDATGVPLVRPKEQLELFRLRGNGGHPATD
jgi:hypothetical protein